MKQKRYWLRGGSLAATICIVLQIPYQSCVVDGGGWDCLIWGLPLLPIIKIYSVFLVIIGYANPNIIGGGVQFSNIEIGIVNLIGYFIIGVILGWFYGKIKNRPSFSNPNR